MPVDHRPRTSEPTASLDSRIEHTKRVSLLVYHRDGASIADLVNHVPLVVGRARPSDVVTADASMSRQHARFTRDGDVVWVEDLGSTNGTRINGKLTERGRIRPGDDATLGSVAVSIHVLEPAEAHLQGIPSFERFMSDLDQEVLRARTFGRTLTLLLVRAARPDKARLARWCPRLRALLRPIDQLALYSPDAIIIRLAEADLHVGQELAQEIVDGHQRGEPALMVGVVAFPQHGASSEALVAAACAAARRSRPREPVVCGPDPERPQRQVGSASIVAESSMMQEVLLSVIEIADAALPVLICGETGTGKEVIAQLIHEKSGRAGPLRAVNCAAIPRELLESTLFGYERGAFTGAKGPAKGLFEQAHRGTLMLDEVGELSPAAQAALLRVLETHQVTRIGSERDRSVDVRLLAATNADLERLCDRGHFRSDLFYRLNVLQIDLPPLRERTEDIVPLALHFVRAATGRRGVGDIDDAARRLLLRYSWPGNVRELRNVIERAAVLSRNETINAQDLPQRVRAPSRSPVSGTRLAASTRCMADIPAAGEGEWNIRQRMRDYEAELLVQALEEHDWNQTAAAKALGLSLRALVYKLRSHGIARRYTRPETS